MKQNNQHSIAFYKKIENPSRAPKVIILTSGGQPGGGRRAQGQLPPCHPSSAAHGCLR